MRGELPSIGSGEGDYPAAEFTGLERAANDIRDPPLVLIAISKSSFTARAWTWRANTSS